MPAHLKHCRRVVSPAKPQADLWERRSAAIRHAEATHQVCGLKSSVGVLPDAGLADDVGRRDVPSLGNVIHNCSRPRGHVWAVRSTYCWRGTFPRYKWFLYRHWRSPRSRLSHGAGCRHSDRPRTFTKSTTPSVRQAVVSGRGHGSSRQLAQHVRSHQSRPHAAFRLQQHQRTRRI